MFFILKIIFRNCNNILFIVVIGIIGEYVGLILMKIKFQKFIRQ